MTRGPRSPLAQSAMAELEQACILFSKASVYSIRATKALVRYIFLDIFFTTLRISIFSLSLSS